MVADAPYPFTKANVDETADMIYQFIVNYMRRNSYAPTVREICRGVGLKSTSTVHSHLKRLDEQGRIELDQGKRRALRVPELDSVLDTDEIPLLGLVTAGLPIFATENIECMLRLPTGVYPSTEEMFALRVRGDSMVDAAILDGDLVIVRKQSAADAGDIIVALIGDDATVKTLAHDNEGRPFLHPQNDAYPDIPFDTEYCKILGVVCGVLRFRV